MGGLLLYNEGKLYWIDKRKVSPKLFILFFKSTLYIWEHDLF